MLQVKTTNIDDGNLVSKIDNALQRLGHDIVGRPEVKMWIAFDFDQGDMILCTTEQEAHDKAQAFLDWSKNFAEREGWPDAYENNVGYAKVVQTNQETEIANKEDYTDEEWEELRYDPEWDKVIDYELR